MLIYFAMDKNIFKSIGNITRVKILACLGQSDKAVNELITNCSLSQSAVSQHLAYLRSVGLISATRKGRQQIYRVSNPRLAEICKRLLEIYFEENN
jgi:ArsR family transcriptional regulator